MANEDLLLRIGADPSDAIAAAKKARQSIVDEMRATATEVSKVNVGSNVLGIRQQVGNLSGLLKEFAGAAKLNLGPFGDALDAIGGKGNIAAVGIGLVTGAAVSAATALFDAAKFASDFGSEIHDLGQKTSLSAETLSTLKVVAEQSGSSLKEVGNAVTILNRKLVEAQSGSKELQRVFGTLGVDLKGTSEDALRVIVKRFAELEDGQLKVKLATEIFGKAGANLIPTLDALEGNLDGQIAKMKELGLVIDDKTAAAADEFGDKLDTLQKQLQGIKIEIGNSTIPALTAMAEVLRGIITDSRDATSEVNKFADAAASIGASGIAVRLAQQAAKAIIDSENAARLEKTSGTDEITSVDFANSIAATTAAVEAVRRNEELKKQLKDALEKRARTPKDNAESQQQQQQLKSLERSNREIEREYRDATERIKRQFDQRVITEHELTLRLEIEAEKRRAQTEANLLDEVQLLSGSKLKPTQLADALDRIRTTRANAERELARERERIAVESKARLEAAEVAFQKVTLDLAEQTRERRIATIKDAVDQAALSYEEGERRIAAILLAGFAERLRLAEEEVDRAGANVQLREVAEARLRAIIGQRAAAEEDAARRVKAARQRDLDDRLRFEQELARIQQEAAQQRIDTAGSFGGGQAQAIRDRAEIERQAVNLQSQQVQRRLQAELDAIHVAAGEDEASTAAKLRRARELTELLVAEEQRRRAKIEGINRKETTDTAAADPFGFASQFGQAASDALDQFGNKLTGFAAVVAGFKAKVTADMNAMAASTASPLAKIGGALAQAASGFALTALASIAAGKGIAGALKAAAAATLASIAQIAGVEALKNVAYGLNALGYTIFTADPRGALAASHYFAAAAAWGAIGIGAAIGAGAISGGGASGASGALGNQLTGTRQGENTIPTEDRYRYRDIGPNPLNTMITIKLETDQPMLIKKVEQANLNSYNSQGALKQILDKHSSDIPIGG